MVNKKGGYLIMDDATVTKTGLAGLIAVVSYLSGRFSDLFWIFCILMLIDYFTGYIAAWITKTKNSRIGLIGIIKKVMYVVFVLFGFILDMAIIKILGQLNIPFSFGDIGGLSLGVIIIIFYIGNETISIVENFEKMGLKTPKWLSKIGSLLKDIPTTILKPLVKKGEKYIEEVENDESDKDKTTDVSKKR